MHIPDGKFLTPQVFIPLDIVAGLVIAGAAALANRRFTEERHVPLLGATGAFVFAAQMLNVAIPGGTSGHFLGAALIAILLGPASAVIVFTAVLLIQCFLFNDGGAYVLGANIFNMAVVGGGSAYLVDRAVRSLLSARPELGRKVAAFAAAWVSIVLSAAACSVELAISYPDKFPPQLVVPFMIGAHAIVGVLEGFVTVAAVELVARARPDLLELEKV